VKFTLPKSSSGSVPLESEGASAMISALARAAAAQVLLTVWLQPRVSSEIFSVNLPPLALHERR
jgi:hypothetical protein